MLKQLKATVLVAVSLVFFCSITLSHKQYIGKSWKAHEVEKLGHMTVIVYGETADTAWLGSGVFIDKIGTVLTAAHVVSMPGAVIKIVTTKGLQYDCNVLAIDTGRDLGVIRVKASAQRFSFATFQKAKEFVGQDILIIGHPSSLYWTVSKGIITRLYIVVAYPSIFSKRIETDSFVNPGSSGGPVFNEKGQLIGIVSAMWVSKFGQPMGIGILIPVSEVRRFLKQNYNKVYPPISKPRYRLGDLK